MTTLSPSDIKDHARLGITVDVLERAQARRVDDVEARELLNSTHSGNLAGILYPYVNPRTGHAWTYRVRRDHPEIEDGKPKAKYLSASGDQRRLYFPPTCAAHLKDPSILIVAVEAEKSVLAVTCAAHGLDRPVLAIGLGGCWGWRGRIGKATDADGATVDETGPLPDLDLITWTDRDVVIAFDANVAVNTKVQAARRMFAKELIGRGAIVRVVDLPVEAGVNGPDDHIGRHGAEAFFTLIDSAGQASDDSFRLTDTGNAEFFASRSGDVVRYDHGRRGWFVFAGQHWVLDRTEHVDRLALDAIRARQKLAFTITDEAKRARQLNWTVQSESRARRDNLVRLATKLPTLAITGDEWDTDPWLLGVQNGVIDLRTGQLRDGRPGDYITKVASVSYDAGARCPRWKRFLQEVFADHPEIAQYLQRVFGYALTGVTTEQAFWILCGDGANGKSTLMETVMTHVIGADYSWTMPFPTAGWSNAMSEYQKASLTGRRVVAASEVTRRGCLNEELIKSLTGNDTINARHPYGRPFTYSPVAKIFLRVNDKPVIRDQSHGMWRRVKLVPFAQTFAVDTTLADTLAMEASGILAWAVQGCLDWQRDGLQHPDAVEVATKEYQSESDTLTEFIEDRCVVGAGYRVGAQALFEDYRSWCDARHLSDEDRLNQKAFGGNIRKRFSVEEKRTVTYLGVGLVVGAPLGK